MIRTENFGNGRFWTDAIQIPGSPMRPRQRLHGPAAEPLSFRNDYMGSLQEVYRYDDSGKKTHVNTKLKQFKSFAKSPPRRIETRGIPSNRKSWMEYFDL
ncbi:MAG: hypothetical protein ABI955_00235 [Nitrospirota bacterium]